MHAAAFRALGLPHTYEAIRATPAELPAIVAALREGKYDGLNVTIPHKRAVMALVDELDASAAFAVNTLVRTPEGRVIGHNTDAPALAVELHALAPAGTTWSAARGLVLGSGGGALAAVAALRVGLGAREVVVRARGFEDPARREKHWMLESLSRVTLQPWAPSPESEASTTVVVQATSAGMRGADRGDEVARVVAWDALPRTAVALDLVYEPRSTPFLRAAWSHGLAAVNGLGMLARQGAGALELWLGVEAPLPAMLAALS